MPVRAKASLFPFACQIMTIVLCLQGGPVGAVDRSKSPARQQAIQPVLIDTILASVNGKPVTLRQLEARLRTPRRLPLNTLAAEPEVRYLLDLLILEQLILDEADNRKLTATDGEIDRYLEEIAARNSLSRAGFEEALKREGRQIDDYKRQVRVEILKSRLTNSLVQAGVGVTDQEVTNYIAEHPELSKTGSKIKLSQIFVAFAGRSVEEARARIDEVRRKLDADGDFSALAREFSDGGEAAEGGSLGVLAEKDLSPLMFDTVFSLKNGQVSDIVTSESGFHIFKLIERIGDGSEENSKLADEVRAILEKEKTARSVQDFFTQEIFKKHSVDKKI